MKIDNEYKYRRAKEKVQKIKGFYFGVAAYFIVIPFLAMVNYLGNGFAFPWVVFPAVGWGIGIFFHYMDTYGHCLFFGKKWEARKIKEYLEKNK